MCREWSMYQHLALVAARWSGNNDLCFDKLASVGMFLMLPKKGATYARFHACTGKRDGIDGIGTQKLII